MSKDKKLFELIMKSESPVPGITVAARISFLVVANGGFSVSEWGFISSHDWGHQKGMAQDEALELLYWHGFFNGARDLGHIDAFEMFAPYYNHYLQKCGAPVDMFVDEGEQ